MSHRITFTLLLIAGLAGAPTLRAADAPKPAAAAAAAAAPKADLAKFDASQPPAPNWIWGAGKPQDNQSVYFRTTFDSGVAEGKAPKSAILFASCDNELEVLLNGNKIGRSAAWERPIVEDVTKLIRPGRNLIAVPAKNAEGSAGLVLKLRIVTEDGTRVNVVTDGSWKATSDVGGPWWEPTFDDADWKPARVVAKYGDQPWGKLPKDAGPGGMKPGEATPAEQITMLPGFKIERLYSVPKETQGSWVSMCVDPKGRLVVSDQYGGLFRVTPPAIGKPASDTKVEPLNVPIGMAQGLLFAFDSLYVVVNDGKGIDGRSSGLYRLPYDAKADTFGKPTLLKAFPNRTGKGPAAGEHGPHAIRLGPDGKLYVIAGNFTGLPEGVTAAPVKNYADDWLLPRMADVGGHDPAVWAPAGWICRTDADGKTWEHIVTGMRNAYDFDFHADGETFSYDSDMEWDTGSPWYRPTRVLLGASAAEFGWRNGTGKWMDYYPDNLPGVINTGLGSPTGVAFGYGAKFPAKYQNALYLVDWAYGKVYAAHITPEGAGYRGTFEPFAEGKAFDGTDIVVGNDGAMYLTIGGRKTQSGLYRITYTGSEPTLPLQRESKPDAGAEARKLRKQLEVFHGKQDPLAVEFAWDHLNSPDRYIRYAARVAVEWQDLALWRDKALAEKRPTALINAMVALCRTANPADAGKDGNPPAYASPNGDPALLAKVLAALNGLQLKSLSEEQVLEATRAYQLAFIRVGKPDEQAASQLAAKLDPLYPSPSYNVNKEVGQLLAYLNAPSLVPETMQLLAAARTQEEQLQCVLVLRLMTRGWTPELRKAYFSWINHAEKNYRGGSAFKKFIARIREDAAKTLTDEEKTALAAVLKGQETAVTVQETAPRQFVRNWQMQDLIPALADATHGRSFEKGKAAFDAVGCIKCHRFAGDGGSTGPDLTGVGNRFQPVDVLEAILLPSKQISDQYQPTEVRTTDGDAFIGTVAGEDAESLKIMTNPYTTDATVVKKSDIKTRQPSKVSLMPEGTVDVLTKDEILDLIAYLRSGGNPKDKAFGP